MSCIIPKAGKNMPRATGPWDSNDSPIPLGSQGWKKEIPNWLYQEVHIVPQILPANRHRHETQESLPFPIPRLFVT